MKTFKIMASMFAVILLAGCGGIFTGKSASETAITQFHDLYNQGNLDEIWTTASPKFCAASTKQKYADFMGAIQRKLGKVVSTSNENWNVKSYNFTTTVYMRQQTVFEHGNGTEAFTFTMTGTNAVLLAYDIRSMDLIIK